MANHVVGDTFLAQFLGALGAPRVNAMIDNDDEMFRYILKGLADRDQAVCQYLRTGKEILDAVTEVVKWKFGGFDGVTSFLDFGCGYGRSTRFLVNRLPAERVWVSDISASAVRFQEEQFLVHAFRSAPEPGSLECDRRFDCVFVMSLFTHLPETTFIPWLRKLYSLMNEDGVLIFTVHDQSLNPGLEMPPSGLWFEEESEIDTISKREYGCTLVSEAFVRAAIEQATGGRGSYRRVPRGVNRYQDMYIVVNGLTASELENFEYAWDPVGHLEVCKMSASNLLSLSGWAGDFTPRAKIQDIQILIDGEVVQRCLPFARRPDVAVALGDPRFSASGFSCDCRIPEHASESSALTMNVVSDSGLNSVLYHNRLATAVGASGPV